MSGITYEYMEEFIRGLITEHNDKITLLEEYAHVNSVPIIQKEVAKFLELMINLKKPRKILELGTAIGYSAILMNMATNGKAEVVTIERDKLMIELARKNIEEFGLSSKISVVEGECLEELKKLNGEFDFIFVDAGKGHYNHFLPECLRLLSEDGVIVADNVLFRGMVASPELVKRRKITIVKRMRAYLNEINSNENLITSVLPMGDGIAVTVRRNKND
jgi:caffeoyl-CoA O-methyltransferase